MEGKTTKGFSPLLAFLKLFTLGSTVSGSLTALTGETESRMLAIFIVNTVFFVAPGSLLITRILSWKNGKGFLPARKRKLKCSPENKPSSHDAIPFHMVDETDPYKGGICEGWYSGFDPWDFMYKKRRRRGRRSSKNERPK